MQIEKRLAEKNDKIERLNKSKRVLTTTLKLRNAKSQVLTPQNASPSRSLSLGRSMDLDKPLFNYKSIMCPLKDKCPDDVRPRWPNTETKSISKLGRTCPYAHHYSELHFPYFIAVL